MKRTLTLVEQVIEEHKTIFQRLDQVVNDAEALRSFEEAQEVFMPGRLDRKVWEDKLVGLVNLIDRGLQAHFTGKKQQCLPLLKKSVTVISLPPFVPFCWSMETSEIALPMPNTVFLN